MTSNEILGLIGFVLFCMAALAVIIFTVIYLFLAEKKIFYTFHKRNSIQAIVTGKGEEFTGKIIFPSIDQYLDESSNIVTILPADLRNQTDDVKRYMQKPNWLGMYKIYGYPFHTIFMYRKVWQEWISTETIDTQGNPVVARKLGPMRDELTPYLFTKRQEYGFAVLEAENAEGYSLDLEVAYYCKPSNYKTAIIDVKDSFGQLQTQIQGATNLFVKVETFKSLDALKKAARTKDEILDEHDRYSEFIINLNKQIPGEKDDAGVISELGWELLGAKIMSVKISGPLSQEINEATIRVGIETANTEANVVKAEGDKKVTILGAEAEKKKTILQAEGLAKQMNLITEAKEKRIKIFKGNPEAVSIEIAEKTFENSKLTTYVAGNPDTKVNVNLNN